MPARGYRKQNPKDAVVRFRVTVEQAERLEAMAKAAGSKSLSAWARSVVLAAAGLGGETEKD